MISHFCCWIAFTEAIRNFCRRFARLRQKDPNFDERWKHLGELPIQTEFNWDKEIEQDPFTKDIVNTR